MPGLRSGVAPTGMPVEGIGDPGLDLGNRVATRRAGSDLKPFGLDERKRTQNWCNTNPYAGTAPALTRR